MSLVATAIKRPVSTIAATLGVVLLGSVSLGRMPVSLLPDVTLPVLTIRTLYADAAATEVSRFVAEPIERAVAATPGLVELRSVSRNGEATTTLRFAWGTNMQGTLLNVREQLDNARGALPGGIRMKARPDRVVVSTIGSTATIRPMIGLFPAAALVTMAWPPSRISGRSCSSTCASTRRAPRLTTRVRSSPALTRMPTAISTWSTRPSNGLMTVAFSRSNFARSS